MCAPGGHEANEASRARMAIETCEKHAVEGVGRVAERASIRDDNRRILCTHKDGRCEEAKVPTSQWQRSQI